jgi:lipoate-protein ligase B
MPTPSSTSVKLPPHQGRLEVHLLGLVDFDAMLGLQEQQIYELSGRDDLFGMLFLCEHPPIISMGREASRSQLLLDDDELARRELAVRWVSRGGGAFIHAPGQLAIYLQIPLARLGLGLSDFRQLFEESLVSACRELKIPAKRQSDEAGIWSRGGQLACFGAGVKSWITCQGMFLNLSIDPALLHLTVANPLGSRSTSVQSQRLDPIPTSRVRATIIDKIAEHFGYDSPEVSTGHPLLKRTTQRVLLHA